MILFRCLLSLIGISCLFHAIGAVAFYLSSNTSDSSVSDVTSYQFTESHSIEHEEEHNDEHSGGVHLAAWNYDYVAVPLDISLFILLAGLVKIAFHHVPYLSSYIPESCVLIIIGTIMGAILYFAAGVPDSFRLDTRTFMLYLLPPIVLEASYSLNDRSFSDNIGTILLYAVVGTVLNFIIIGFAMYGLDQAGAMGLPDTMPVTMLQFLLFASFIVAVDPVAVLAIFQDIGVNKTLYFLVFGESLLNDAVTIVINNMMRAFNDVPNIEVDDILIGIASFFTISLGALSIGILFGIISSLLTRVTGHVRVVEPLAILIIAYLSYLCAELFHWSGIISMIGCGLVQAQYALHNISRKSNITVNYFIKMLSSTCDSIIFLFLGLELVRTEHVWNTGFVLWALFLCLVARLFSVFFLTFLVNLTHKNHPIKLEEQFVMWYGGLRGAIAFALCSTIDLDETVKDMFLTTTFVIILFTVFGQGITIKPLVKYCKIMMDGEQSKDLLLELQNLVTGSMISGIKILIGQHAETNFHTWLYKVNEQYFRRWFQKKPLTDEEQFLDLYKQVSLKYYEAMISGNAVPLPIATQIIQLRDGSYASSLDLTNDKKEEEFASEIKQELQAGKEEPISKGEMHRILSRASLGGAAWQHDRDLRYHDVEEGPGTLLYKQVHEDIMRSTLDVSRSGVVSFGDTLQLLNSGDQTPTFGSTSMIRSSPLVLTPASSMWHLTNLRTPATAGVMTSPFDDPSFQLRKATSVLSLSEAQERMIVPTLIINSSVQRKVKKRLTSEHSISAISQPHLLFLPSRSRKNSTAYDSKRLTTLGEEQVEEMMMSENEAFDMDQKEASKDGAYINRVMYDTVLSDTMESKTDQKTKAGDTGGSSDPDSHTTSF